MFSTYSKLHHSTFQTFYWLEQKRISVVVSYSPTLYFKFFHKIVSLFRLLLEETSSVLTVNCKSWSPVTTSKHPFVLPRYSWDGFPMIFSLVIQQSPRSAEAAPHQGDGGRGAPEGEFQADFRSQYVGEGNQERPGQQSQREGFVSFICRVHLTKGGPKVKLGRT